ncbi:MAG: hypothetical protein FJ267_11120 [Planctomycetes bacterium]|nr:hypothetical protein [Planctomycetota bacterium]
MINPDAVFSPASPATPSTSDPSTQPLTQSPSDMSTNSQPSSSINSLSAGQGSLTAQNSAPAFLGDFFGGATAQIAGPVMGTAGPASIATQTSVGVMKLAENTSPLPRDRVFSSFNYFDNVNLVPGGMSVYRFTPGFEKTFFNGQSSIEVRVPMARTLSSSTVTDGSSIFYDTDQYEIGNLTTYFKVLLWGNDQFALSSGVGVAAPTADDIRLYDTGGDALAVIKNDVWHIMPFIGSVFTPTDRLYFQNLIQLDTATSGNSISILDGVLTKAGYLNDPTFLFCSMGTGYWLYQSDDPSSAISRVSVLSEIHFNNSLQKTDVVTANDGSTVGAPAQRIQSINGIIGTNVMLGENRSLTLGYVVPIGNGSDQAFDGEFRALFNWYFGSTDRQSRVQF